MGVGTLGSELDLRVSMMKMNAPSGGPSIIISSSDVESIKTTTRKRKAGDDDDHDDDRTTRMKRKAGDEDRIRYSMDLAADHAAKKLLKGLEVQRMARGEQFGPNYPGAAPRTMTQTATSLPCLLGRSVTSSAPSASSPLRKANLRAMARPSVKATATM